jgi:D-beta-D-heptose 7-phosphate kinase/D-beta-D-heptose 1-phosphate adenosyltransferase
MKRVWVNGTFDVLHRGHVELLSFASTLGTVRVGIDGDARVKELKGSGRPFNNEADRSYMLLNLRSVSSVAIFYSDRDLEEHIKSWEPHYFVIGDDYRDKLIIGREYAKEVIFFERLPMYSTTSILKSQSS